MSPAAPTNTYCFPCDEFYEGECPTHGALRVVGTPTILSGDPGDEQPDDDARRGCGSID